MEINRQSMSRDEAALASAKNALQSDTVRAEQVLKEAIGKEQVSEATRILNEYKSGKAQLDQRIIEAEKWYRLRHWDTMRRGDGNNQVEPSSAWLYNCITQKHADMMDNIPAPNILPREESDKEEASRLSSIIPVVTEQCQFEKTYDDCSHAFLKYGTAAAGVFWDATKYNGLGDIDIRKISLLNIFSEPGIRDIQKSRNLFTVELVDNDVLQEQYPQTIGKLSSPTVTPSEFVHDESISTSDKSAVVDWYYKKTVNGKTVLHYVKYVNDVVLYATENMRDPVVAEDGTVIAPAPAEAGLYDDGRYPFVLCPFNENEGSPFGFGMIDIGKSAQEWIDRGNKAIMQSMMVNAKPRYLVRQDCDINEDDFRDTEKDIIRYSGTSPNDAATPLQTAPVSAIYVQILQYKIDELKEVTGNRDVSTGGSASGVTAASAIAAMQEAASKGSRDINKKMYRWYREIIDMVIERIRQFYNLPRQFRIVGERGAMKFIDYSNANLKAQDQGMDFGVEGGYRLPVMDIEVTAQKASPYSKMSQNELALELYKDGFFQPDNADNALAALEMMDFDHKDEVEQRVAENGTLLQQIQMLQAQMLQMAQIIDGLKGTNMADQLGAQILGTNAPPVEGGELSPEENNALGGDEKKLGESKITKNARKRAAEATAP